MSKTLRTDPKRLICDMPGMVFVVSGEGRVLRASRAAANRGGFSRERPRTDLFRLGVVSRSRWPRLVAQAEKAGRAEWSSRGTPCIDPEKPARYLLSRVTDGPETCWVVFQIACRCDLERPSRKSGEARLNRLFEGSNTVHYCVVDKGAHRISAFATPNARRVLGWNWSSRGTPFFWTWSVHPDDLVRVLREMRSSGEKPGVVEYRFRRRDGKIIFLQNEYRTRRTASGDVVRTGSWRDISGVIRDPIGGKGFSAKERRLLDALPVAVEFVDRNGVVTFANAKTGELTGVDLDRRVGRKLVDLQPTRWEAERVRRDFDNLIRHHPAPEPYFHRNKHPVRGDYQLRVDWNYRYDSRRRVIGITSVLSDASAAARGPGSIQGFSRSMIAAQEEERARVARELHDGVCQLLAAAKMGLSGEERQGEGPGEILAEAIAEVRRITQELHSTALEDGELSRALQERVLSFGRRTGIQARYTVRGSVPRLSSEACHALYRILQEALENVRRHARARGVAVSLRNMKGGVRLVVSDNGRGFSPNRTVDGVGLRSVRHRAEILGGLIRTISAKGRGATIDVFLPSAENGDDARR